MEATVQTLTTSLPSEEPFIGDGAEGELITNTADGRVWVADVSGNPIELGGSCVNKPINANLFAGNYLDLDVTNPDNLPVPVPNPNDIPAGFYREIRILLRFVGNPLPLVTYFDYDVDWAEGIDPSTYAKSGALILVELSAFGPSPKWLGKIVWIRDQLGVLQSDQTSISINDVIPEGTQLLQLEEEDLTATDRVKKVSELPAQADLKDFDSVLLLKSNEDGTFSSRKASSFTLEEYVKQYSMVDRSRIPSSVNTDKINNQKEAAIFLRNCTLGPTINEINSLVELGSKRDWITDQIYGSYDGSEYSEWDTTTGIAKTLKPGWFAKVALHFKMPDDYVEGNFRVHFPGSVNTRQSLLSAFIRNNPVSGDIGSLNGSTRKDPRKSLLSKVTWILNKLIPVSVPGGGFPEEVDTYPIVDWYGNVLARHAFGNYADLLEEVSYNLSMSRMLTHLRNQKADETGRQPDENYGREIMQLFSIGLYALNIDGTYKLNENGNRIETYDQFDILESSKVFTGLTRWDRPEAEYYDPTKESIMRGGGVSLEGIGRTSFLAEQTIYGIAKPVSSVRKGSTYRIYSQGNTDFTKIGALNNNVGTEFVALSEGSGTGLVEEKRVYPVGVVPRLKHFLPWYEDGEKNFPNIGVVIPAGTDPETNIRMMCEGLVNHPNCAPNISKNLIKLSVTSNPSPEYVARVASVFKDNGRGVTGDMAAVWTAIFTDPEANQTIKSSETKGRVLDGFEVFCKYIRSLDGSSRTENLNFESQKTYIDGVEQNPAVGMIIDNENGRLGSWPYSSPSVFSYYSLDYSITPGSDWGILLPEIGSLPANTLMNSINVFNDMINSGNPINWRANPSTVNRVYTPDFSVSLGDLTDINNVIEKLDLLLCSGSLSKDKKSLMGELLSSMPTANGQDDLDDRVCVALQLIVRSPEFWIN